MRTTSVTWLWLLEAWAVLTGSGVVILVGTVAAQELLERQRKAQVRRGSEVGPGT